MIDYNFLFKVDLRRFIDRLVSVYTAPNEFQESRFLLILKTNCPVGAELWLQYKKRVATSSAPFKVEEATKQWDESPTSSCAEVVTPSRELVIRWMAPYLRRFSKYIPSQNMWLCDQRRMGPEYMNRDAGEMYLRQEVLEGVEMPMYLKVMLRGITDEELPCYIYTHNT
ncbi:unnamed protein product [Rhizophagus irregularis]|nr:unnamed protein product [Rhizophagus irregularis]